MTLSLYDGVMLAIVVFCVIQGAIKGMAWQLAPIASLVMGYLFGVPLSAATAPWFGQPPLNRVFALIVMYMLVSLGVYLIARSLRESIEKMKLVEFDRHLGAILGGVKGLLFTTVLTVAFVCVSPTAAGLIVNSESRSIAENVIDTVSPLLPPDVLQVIAPYLTPIENLPAPQKRTVANEDDSARIEDAATSPTDAPAPRTRRRNQPIYEDDNGSGLDERLPYETDPAPRRSQPDDASNSRTYDPLSDDDGFGIDPSQAFEAETAPRRR